MTRVIDSLCICQKCNIFSLCNISVFLLYRKFASGNIKVVYTDCAINLEVLGLQKISQVMKIRPSMITVILCALIVGWLIFLKPIHGYSDNGDFQSLMATNDLYRTHQIPAGYVSPHFGLMQCYNPLYLKQITAQTAVIQIAVGLNRLFYSRSVFDIRFLGAVYYVLYLGGVAVLARGLVGGERRLRHYLMAAAVTLFVADSSFTLYFNSFYPQALTFILMLYLAGFALLIMRGKTLNKWLTAGLFLSAILLLLVHESTSLLILGILIVSIGIFSLPDCQWRHGSAVIICLLLFTCWVSANHITREVREMNKYQAMTQGKLLAAAKPAEIAKTSHIDGQFSLMKGESYYPTAYTALAPDSDYTRKNFTQQYNLPWLIHDYLTHPHQFGLLLDKAAKNTMVLRPRLTGTQEKRTGSKPFQQTHYFSLFSYLAGTYYPKTYGFNCLLAVAVLIIYGSGLMRGSKKEQQLLKAHFWLVSGLLSVVVLVPPATIMFYGTANFVIHMLPVAVCLSLTGLILLSDVVQHQLWGNSNAT
ncbi:membrane protein [Secundilactobacillus pentosiphilus]|uniref:Membrane protein n=1 Tax=Secundilactobacillus pentosiphilus TaxID=1714682 RepID=A0A1Z5IPH9_9LACO|nr:membrane protein [Secundilactobacillus pentosiphilus]